MERDPALDTFIAEANELLRDMESVLLLCEQGAADPEAINGLFRVAHTIKGSAGLFGLDPIVAFTHVVESVLDKARMNAEPIKSGVAGVLLECGDHIQKLVDAVASGGSLVDPEFAHAGQDLLERLKSQSGYSVGAQSAPATAPAKPAAIAHSGPATDGPGLRVSGNSWHISVRFDRNVLRNGMDPLAFIRYLTTFGKITGIQVVDDALPEADEFDPESCYLGFEIGLETDEPKTRIEAAFEFVREDCSLQILPPRSLVSSYVSLIRDLPEGGRHLGELLVNCGSLTETELASALAMQAELEATQGSAPPLGQILVESRAIQAPVVEAAVTQQNESRAARKSDSVESRSIRVDGDKLDRLIDLIGELIIAGAATGSEARDAGLARLNESALHLARIVEEVRDQALKLRIVQIGPTFSRFQRVVRDVARESGKDITLEIGGSETELDKTLVERIADPLTHLVRNAIDHGIEKPEVRVQAGKPAAGTVRLNAFHDAGSVVIEVSDDGGGLKRDRILKKATERGLVPEGATLSDQEIFALIFEPGFSTAEQVTNLSGRGVGMDVVKSNVTALRGTVEIDSQPGRGTQVRLRLPLTLAIIDGFLVGVGRSAFVIPLDFVEQCVALPEEAPNAAESGTGHINLHGAVLPLIRLRNVFEIAGQSGRRQSVVVVKSAGKRVGIVVDELLGELQAVIKPLSKLFEQLQGVAGSTILGNGNVALILDLPGLTARGQDHSTRLYGTPPVGRAVLESTAG